MGVEGGGRGKEEEKKKIYRRHNRGNQTAPAAENGKETHDKLDHGQYQGNDKRPVHPARHLGVHFHAAVIFVAQNRLHARVVQLPDGQRVKVELELAGRAKGNLLLARLVVDNVAFAVGEEADLVKVLEFLGACLGRDGVEEVVVDFDAGGELVRDGRGVERDVGCVGLRADC